VWKKEVETKKSANSTTNMQVLLVLFCQYGSTRTSTSRVYKLNSFALLCINKSLCKVTLLYKRCDL
jgi:hypothetical protein